MGLSRYHALGAAAALLAGCLRTSGDGGCGATLAAGACRCGDEPAPAEPERAAGDPIRGGTVRVRLAVEPASLLPLLDSDAEVRAVVDGAVLEPLVRAADGKGGVETVLASAVDESADGMVFLFTMDEKARWHDGRPVTAGDVAFTFSKILDPDEATALTSAFLDLAEVAAVDDSHVRFRLDRRRSDFLRRLAAVPILPAHVFGRAPLAESEAARSPVGSGPFKFVRWVPGRVIELQRNPLWRGARPYLDRLEYWIVPDERVARDLFRRGDLDLVLGLPGSFRAPLEEGRLVPYALPSVTGFLYNTRRPLFAREEVRRAVALLFDREAIRCSILRCRADLAQGPWPPGEAASPRAPLAYDPAAARALLDAGGWIDRDGDGIRERGGAKLSFSLLVPEGDGDLQRVVSVVAEDLRGGGMELHPVTVSRATFEARLAAAEFDAAAVALDNSPYFDPGRYFHSRALGGGENWAGFGDPALDGAMDAWATEGDADRVLELEKEISARLVEAQVLTFAFRPHAVAAARRDLRGLSFRDGWFDARLLWRAAGPQVAATPEAR